MAEVYIAPPADTMHESAFLGDLFTLQKLLDNEGTDVDALEAGQTPLHLACASGRENVARYLLGTAHSNPDSKSAAGSGPIHIATRNGHSAVVELLLSFGVSPDARGANNQTPLMFSCQKGHVDVARLLLEKGADPNLQVSPATPQRHSATASPGAQPPAPLRVSQPQQSGCPARPAGRQRPDGGGHDHRLALHPPAPPPHHADIPSAARRPAAPGINPRRIVSAAVALARVAAHPPIPPSPLGGPRWTRSRC